MPTRKTPPGGSATAPGLANFGSLPPPRKGSIGAAANGSLGMVYAGRFIAGLGVGQTTVVGPTYLSEVAPKFTRGLCVCIFAGSAYFGIMLGYLCIYGFFH